MNMLMSDWVTAVISFLGLAVNSALLVMVYRQLTGLGNQVEIGRAQNEAGLRAVELDHQRRRRQATIDFYAITVEKRSSLGSFLPYDRDRASIDVFVDQIGQEHNEKVRGLMEYLDLFEILATGVRLDVFDIEVVEGIATSQIRDMANFYRPWIMERRDFLRDRTTAGSDELYCEIFELADRLTARGEEYSRSVESRRTAAPN